MDGECQPFGPIDNNFFARNPFSIILRMLSFGIVKKLDQKLVGVFAKLFLFDSKHLLAQSKDFELRFLLSFSKLTLLILTKYHAKYIISRDF